MTEKTIEFLQEGKELRVVSCELRHGNLGDALISVAVTMDKPTVTVFLPSVVNSVPVVTLYSAMVQLYGQRKVDANFGVPPVRVSLPTLANYSVLDVICDHKTALVILANKGV